MQGKEKNLPIKKSRYEEKSPQPLFTKEGKDERCKGRRIIKGARGI